MADPLARLRRKKRLRVAGLMSGTSADGVDAAVVDIARGRVRVVAFATYPYPAALRRAVLDLAHADRARVDDLCRLNVALGEVFAEALLHLARRSRIGLRSIDLVGSHGQTVRHLPPGGRRRGGATLQLGEPSVIAERTGIPTVADFRPRDLAAGGQGAPLVPFADRFLFRDRRKVRAVQNVGGIANVTFLPPGRGRIIAFDTGPGNMVIDRAAERATRGRQRFDSGGRLAARGRVDPALLAEWMRHPYLRRRPPKSTGREMFGREFADRLYDRARRRGLAPADVVATATAWTAESIADAYRRFLPRRPASAAGEADGPDEVILSGGGARNPALLARLAEALRPARVRLSDEFGIPAEAKEAVAFAILAWAAVRGEAANVPSATGARRGVVLGKIIPGNSC